MFKVKYLIIILAVILFGLSFFELGFYMYVARAVFFLALFIYNHTNTKNDTLLYWFLLLYTISAVIGSLLILHTLDIYKPIVDITFYVCNSLNIVAYIVLLWSVIRKIQFKSDPYRYAFSATILIILGAYLWYNSLDLGVFSNPNWNHNMLDNLLLMIYMAVVVLLLATTVLGFVISVAHKTLFFVIGIISITISEIISAVSLINYSDATMQRLQLAFLIVGFCLIYLQNENLKYQSQGLQIDEISNS